MHAAIESLEDKGSSSIAETWHANPAAIPIFERLGWKWTSIFYRMWFKGRVPARRDVMPGLERLLDLGNPRGIEDHVPHGRRLAFFGTQTRNSHDQHDHAVWTPAKVKEIPLPIIRVR